jgi:hypothetical protein
MYINKDVTFSFVCANGWLPWQDGNLQRTQSLLSRFMDWTRSREV